MNKIKKFHQISKLAFIISLDILLLVIVIFLFVKLIL